MSNIKKNLLINQKIQKEFEIKRVEEKKIEDNEYVPTNLSIMGAGDHIVKAFTDKWLDISDVNDAFGAMYGGEVSIYHSKLNQPWLELAQGIRAYHCVEWAKMSPEVRMELRASIINLLNRKARFSNSNHYVLRLFVELLKKDEDEINDRNNPVLKSDIRSWFDWFKKD